MLWGHSAGTAFAVEAARQMTARALDLRRVFLAAQLPGSPSERRAAAVDLTARTSAEILASLAAGGAFTELGAPDAQRSELLVSAYRHDSLSAHRYLVEALDGPSTVRLTVPVTAVLAGDDPHADPSRYREWERLAEQVELHRLDEGGHYFLRTNPAQAARALLSAAELLAST
jgi:surfactin synthase thioesterase subunit